jgi:hypothetical protein
VPGTGVAVADAALGLRRRKAALIAVPGAATVDDLGRPPGPQRHHLGLAGQRRWSGSELVHLLLLTGRGRTNHRLTRGGRRVMRRVLGVFVRLPLHRGGHAVYGPEAGQAARLAAVVGTGRRLHRIKTPVDRRHHPRGRAGSGGRRAGTRGRCGARTTVPSPVARHTPCAVSMTGSWAGRRSRGRSRRVRENLNCAHT